MASKGKLPCRERHGALRMLDVGEALVFGGRDDDAVLDERRCAVVIDGIDSECVHD